MALGNPQWKTLQNGREVLVIFQGPHAYISPAWYETMPAVPTWNYATVHAYGLPRIITDLSEQTQDLQALIAKHEENRPEPWTYELPAEYMAKMLKGIVGFEILITRLEGKYKMSQNRTPTERTRVASELSASKSGTERAAGKLVEQERH
jgi:transcriptional regulator